MKIHRVVLVGAQGQGKTTFFNTITNQNQETTYAGQSCTRQIVQSQTVYGQGFEVIDTPGFDSSENKLLHISGILAALTFGKVNRILIITKYERNDSIIKNLELVFRPIHRYRSIVTVIFTHWDFCVNGQEEKETQRIKELIEKKFKIESFLFFFKTKDPEITCQEIEAILSSEIQEENIKLIESEIYKHFDILELNSDNADKMSDHLEIILREFSKISSIYIKFINSLNKDDPYFLNILHQITLTIKEEANKKVEEFEKKYGEEILQMVDIQNNNLQYLHYIYLKKEIRQDIEQVINLASKRMKESKYHVFNYLRKCPHCGLIWLKVIGCDGETTCGNAVNSKIDGFLYVQPKKSVQIVRNQNNVVNYQVNESKTFIDDNEFLEQIFKNCFGNKFSEDKIKHLELFQQIIIELYGENYKDLLMDQIIKGELNELMIKSQILNRNNQKQHPPKSSFQSFSSYSLLNPLIELVNIEEINQFYYSQNQKDKSVGCGKKITWSQLPPLTQDEISQLFSSELLEYFADQDKIEKEEIDWLDKSYKKIVNESILQAQNNILILKKNQIQKIGLVEKNQTQ